MADHRLTDTERHLLDQDGYVLREHVFELAEVAAIIGACESLLADVVKDRQSKRYKIGSYVFDPDVVKEVTIKWEGDTDVVHGLEPFAHLSPELDRWAQDARFVDPMIDFVDDPNPALFTEKLNLKRPHQGGINPLHQDYPYWEHLADDATRVATAMVFLDDASVENGTLQVVPGSHRRGKWPTRNDKDGFGNLEIDPTEEKDLETVPLEVAAGAVVFFGPFLAHKSAPNRSPRQRRTLLYSYQPAGFTHGRDLLRARRLSTSERT